MVKKKGAKKSKKSATARKKAGTKKMVRKVVKKTIKKPAKKTAKRKTVKSKKKVLFLPKGYATVTAYLIVGQAARAIDFYKKVFNAKEIMRLQQPGGKIGHAELKIGDAKFMLADECPEMDILSPKAYGGSAISIHLYVKDVDDIINKAVSAGAQLIRPIENMFYGDRTGTILDPFGHKWSIATHIEDVSPAQTKKRAAALFGQ